MAMRWRWPPDNFVPRSPTTVEKPSGRASMKSRQRAASAAGPHLGIRRLGPAVADVFHHRAMQQRDVLRHEGDRPAQALLGDARDVLAVDQDPAAIDVVEALQQRQHRRLAAARRPDQAGALARLDAQAEILEDLAAAGIGEGDVRERDPLAPSTPAAWPRGARGASCGCSRVAIASESRAMCCVTSTSATARSRVACRMVKPSVQTRTTSPALAWPRCQSRIAQASTATVSTIVMTACSRRSFSR